jgi:spore germination protein GerM
VVVLDEKKTSICTNKVPIQTFQNNNRRQQQNNKNNISDDNNNKRSINNQQSAAMARTKRPPTHTSKKKGTVLEQGDESIKTSKNEPTTGLSAAAATRTSPRTSTSVRTKVAHKRDNTSTASDGMSGKSRYVREIILEGLRHASS